MPRPARGPANCRCLLLAVAAFLGFRGAAASAVDFEREIRPLLERRCVACHGPEKQKGGLRLDRKADALAGGDSGRAFVPGDAKGSRLVALVAGDDPDAVMPPQGQRLSPAEVDRLRTWIDQGAPWPDGVGAKPNESSSKRAHWAFAPVRRPASPSVRRAEWVVTPVDAFILAGLEAHGVAPSPEADRTTLVRRLSLDLTGLPPTPEEVDAFASDARPDAYDRLVDRLLASPHFGERWGRHWLDLARYADSDGYEKDSPRPNAWRYRDWVIGAWNRDLPYDRFTVEQLAGDLVPDANTSTRTATGFHRNSLTNTEGGVDREEYRVKAVVDRVNTTGTVWLGLTVGCAQCHSHKYDPLSQAEYYGLFAFFNGQQEVDLPVPGSPPAGKPGKKTTAPAIPTLAARPNPPRTHILIRGDFLRPGDEVLPGTPAVLPTLRTSRGVGADRLDLARWLTDPAHPLTARVAANRVWQALFGVGLVATPDDFGTRGEPPSHPELLDWLASEFVAGGWSQKALIRMVVRSATYRQSSRARPELADRDPANRWLGRQNRLRLEAEVIRDEALACGGLLADRIGGPSVRPPQPAGVADLTYAGSAKWVESRGADRYRRGLYTWFQRTSPYPMLATFDAPDANVCLVRRGRSNTPLQALTLLNEATAVECARAVAGRAWRESSGTDADRLDRLFRLTLGRRPTAGERVTVGRLLDALRAEALAEPEEATRLAGPGRDGAADPVERASWVGVARALLNLDEFVTRE